MDVLRWESRPPLRHPILIASFEGWNDAGEASTLAAKWLSTQWEAQRFATIDPEDFYDFTQARPEVSMSEEGQIGGIDWPANVFEYATIPGIDRDVVFLHGVEPQLKWRTFCAAVTGVAIALECELTITVGALLADVPHTRPTRVTGYALDPSVAERLKLVRSTYEGPTGIVGVLNDAFLHSGLASASLWATVPHYVSQTQSPKAALALVQRLSELIGTEVDVEELVAATSEYETRVNELVAEDEDASAYVESLEAEEAQLRIEYDDMTAEDLLSGDFRYSPNTDEESSTEAKGPVDGDHLAAEVEKFLRNHEK
jgi:predicted ATP-grasp superfamily ATP-dependent carboligase